MIWSEPCQNIVKRQANARTVAVESMTIISMVISIVIWFNSIDPFVKVGYSMVA
jgi:hypothetical protein